MTEPAWRFLYFDNARDAWIEAHQPPLSDIARLRDWRGRVETDGLDPGTVLWDDENFVVRVPNTRVVVAGIAIPFETLLIVKEIRTLGMVT